MRGWVPHERGDGFSGEERPGSGRLRGNDTCVTPGTRVLSAMKHRGRALSGMPTRSCCARSLTRRDSPRGWARRCREQGRHRYLTADGAGVDGGRDRAGCRQHERYRGAGAPGPGAGYRAPGGPTVRHVLDLAGSTAMLERIARARTKARTRARRFIEGTPACGSPASPRTAA
jgi:hypothetical protein